MSIITDTLKRITVNPTELCNRTCPFCPRCDSSVYPNQSLHMSEKTARKIGTDARELGFTGELFIAGFGEPLLHHDLHGIIKRMTHENTFSSVTIVTNGDLLDSKRVELLKLSGVTNVVVSMYDGDHQRDKISCVVGDILPVTYRERYYSIGPENNYGIENINNRGGLVPGRSITSSLNKPCYIPFNKCQIDWNGDVLLCDQDWSRKAIIGNINDSSIGDLWISEQMKQYRDKLLSSRRCMSPCSECDVAGDVYGEQSFDLFKLYYENDSSR